MSITEAQILDEIRGVSWVDQVSFTGANPGGAAALRCRNVQPNIEQMMHELNMAKSVGARGDDPAVVGAEGGGCSFEMLLRGGYLAAASMGTSDLVDMAKTWGVTRRKLPAGADVVTGGGASTLEADDADLAGYAPGDWVACTCDEAGTPDFQVRLISRVQSAAGTTTLTVTPAWDTQPVVGDSIHALDVLIPMAPGAPSAYQAFELYLGGATSGDNRLKAEILGCVGSWKIPMVNAGDVPIVEVEVQADRWTVSAANRDQDNETLDEAKAFLGGRLFFDDDEVSVEGLGFDPGFAITPLVASKGANGRQGWFYGNPKPKLEARLYHSLAYYTALQAATLYKAVAMQADDANHFWGIGIPAVQIMSVGIDALSNNLVGSVPDLVARDPGENADGTDLPLWSMCFSGAGP